MIEDKQRVIHTLNGILELEMAGVVRYVHYSLMIFGYSRIPVVKWMRDQATESMTHAAEAGERITALGGHPSLKIGKLLETHHHGVQQILVEAVDHENAGIALYHQLLDLVRDRDVALEEYARSMIANEVVHVSEIEKMLRTAPRTGDAA